MAVFLEARADLTQKDKRGMAALHISAKREYVRADETVRMLVAVGEPMDIMDKDGNCPIHVHIGRKRT